MLDATKGKTQVVAVLRVLRHEGVYPLTKYSAKKQSLKLYLRGVLNHFLRLIIYAILKLEYLGYDISGE